MREPGGGLADVPVVREPGGGLADVPENPDTGLDRMMDKLLNKEITRRDFLEDANRASTAMTFDKYLRPLEILNEIKGKEKVMGYEEFAKLLKQTEDVYQEVNDGFLYSGGEFPRELWDYLSEKYGPEGVKKAMNIVSKAVDDPKSAPYLKIRREGGSVPNAVDNPKGNREFWAGF